jgi:hypothetical protein
VSAGVRVAPVRARSPRGATLGTALAAAGTTLGVAVATLIGWAYLPDGPSKPDALVLLVLWINLLLSLVFIAIEASRRPFSLHLMHLICYFLFFGIAALYQYTVAVYPIAGPIVTLSRYNLLAALASGLWLLIYAGVYEWHQATARPGPRTGIGRFLYRPITSTHATLNLLLAGGIVAYLAAAGLAGVVTRAAAEGAIDKFASQSGAANYSSVVYLIHTLLLRAGPLVILQGAMLALTRVRKNRTDILLIVGVLLLTFANLVANNPFAAARMWFVTALFGFLAPYVLSRFRGGAVMVAAALVGLVVLPSLGEARRAETWAEFREFLEVSPPTVFLARSGDVDAFGLFALCMSWCDLKGHTWGAQMIGSALLFWVPRTLWASKPIGTGAMVTGDLGFQFTNFSAPIIAEPYVDWGFFGVAGFAALFAVLLSRLDLLYHAGEKPLAEREPRVIDCIYPFWLGCMIFVTRGDFLSGLTNTLAFTFWAIPLAAGASWIAAVSGERRRVAPRGGVGTGSGP